MGVCLDPIGLSLFGCENAFAGKLVDSGKSFQMHNKAQQTWQGRSKKRTLRIQGNLLLKLN